MWLKSSVFSDRSVPKLGIARMRLWLKSSLSNCGTSWNAWFSTVLILLSARMHVFNLVKVLQLVLLIVSIELALKSMVWMLLPPSNHSSFTLFNEVPCKLRLVKPWKCLKPLAPIAKFNAPLKSSSWTRSHWLEPGSPVNATPHYNVQYRHRMELMYKPDTSKELPRLTTFTRLQLDRNSDDTSLNAYVASQTANCVPVR